MKILHVDESRYRRGGAEWSMQGVADLQRAAATMHDHKQTCRSYQFLSNGTIWPDGKFRHAVQTRCKGLLGTSTRQTRESRVHRSLHRHDPVHVFNRPSRSLAGEMVEGGAIPERRHVLDNVAEVTSIPVQEQRRAKAGRGLGPAEHPERLFRLSEVAAGAAAPDGSRV